MGREQSKPAKAGFAQADRRTFLGSAAAGTFAVTLALPDCARAAGAGQLFAGFQTPGDDDKPLTWWHWMNGNVTAEGITLDLEAIHRVGVGGVHMFDVGCGLPQGPARTLSDEWVALVRHAADECNRLGLSFTMHNCPGWSSSGGPWITPELGMQQLVWSEVTVEGGRTVSETVPQPFTRLGHYRDALAIAFPAADTTASHAQGSFVRTQLNGRTIDLRVLTDGDAATCVEIVPSTEPVMLTLEMSDLVLTRSVIIEATPLDDNANFTQRSAFRIEASDDGKRWRQIGEAPVPIWRLHTVPPIIASCQPTSARFYRIAVPVGCTISDIRLTALSRNAAIGTQGGWGRSPNKGEDTGTPSGVDRDRPGLRHRHLRVELDDSGLLAWDAPPGLWTIVRFGHTATGAKNLSASDAGIGLECDKFSKAALDFHFERYFSHLLPALERLGERHLAGALIDSYETGMQNWTGGYPSAFEARRGYSLVPYMPTLTGRTVGDAEVSERFLWDLRRVNAQLMEENYFGRFKELCEARGITTYTEPYGNGPFDDQQAGARMDSLMGEFWVRGGAAAYSVKVAATTAHVHGKSFVGAESFTGRPSQSRWQEHPYAIKALGDEMYCLGLNHFIFHRYAQQPHPTAEPGMTMGPWGFHFDRTNTWFEQAKPWLAYASRCQHMLTRGVFVADILYFAGENSPVQCPVHIEEPVAATLSGARPSLPLPLPDGYDYDVADADVLLNRTRVDGNEIVLPDGLRYRILVLPEDQRITVDVLKRVRDLVTAGAWIVGDPVAQSHGLSGYPQSDAEVARLASELWGDEREYSRKVGRGMVFRRQPLGQVLAAAGRPADVVFAPETSDAALHWIHRRTDDADIYFVANGRRRPENLIATFRAEGPPQTWDAVTGERVMLPVHAEEKGQTKVALRLEEAGSRFVVFPRKSRSSGWSGISGPRGELLSLASRNVTVPRTAEGDFTISAWIKPETELWPITPPIASDRQDPGINVLRAEAMARGGSKGRLGDAGASFLVDPPMPAHGSALAISAGRNGVILYALSDGHYPAILTDDTPISGWTHLAVSVSAGLPSLYLAGRRVASAGAVTEGLGAILGRSIARPRHFEGDVASLTLLGRSSTDTEIAALAREVMPSPAPLPDADLAAGGLRVWSGGTYLLGGRSINVPSPGVPVPLSGPWSVTFPPGKGVDTAIEMEQLASLHRHSDFGVRHFSGTVTYLTGFQLLHAPDDDVRTYVDLGRVEVIARVLVNGRDCGTAWKPPYLVDITSALRSGTNRLEILVTTLWPNRLIGDEHFPPDNSYSVTAFGWTGGIDRLPQWYREGHPKPEGKRIAFTTWKHYDANSPLLESGLLGPVVIRSARIVPLP